MAVMPDGQPVRQMLFWQHAYELNTAVSPTAGDVAIEGFHPDDAPVGFDRDAIGISRLHLRQQLARPVGIQRKDASAIWRIHEREAPRVSEVQPAVWTESKVVGRPQLEAGHLGHNHADAAIRIDTLNRWRHPHLRP